MDNCHQDKCYLDKCHRGVGICSRCFQEPTFEVWLKSSQQQLRYCQNRVCVVVDGGGGWVVESHFLMTIMPRCDSILQAGTCQIFSLAKNPRWSWLWQQLRYSWYGQMLQGQMLLEQMSLWQLKYVQIGPGNLPLQFGQSRASNSWDIADMDKSCQDKCCLDKCHHNSLHRFKMVPGTYV